MRLYDIAFVCRSKNAGPFHLTIDLMFTDRASFDRVLHSPAFTPETIAGLYRTDASRNSSKGGSGIGLSIVKKIMEDHGGQVWATSKEGTGTTMYLALRKYQEVPVHE